MKKRVGYGLLFFLLVITLASLTITAKEQEGVYYYPETLMDARDLYFNGTEVGILARAYNGDTYFLVYELGNPYLTGVYNFLATSIEDIQNGTLPEEEGVYYLPDGVTDVRDIQIINREILITSRTDGGDVAMTIYQMGQSYPTSFVLYQAEPIEKILNNNLTPEHGLYYIPDTTTDVRDVDIIGQEIILTCQTTIGDVAMIFYEMGESYPTSFAIFQATAPEKVDNRELPVEKGMYYIPDGGTDVRAVDFVGNEFVLTAPTDRGDVAMIFYNMGESYPNSYARFQSTEPSKVDNRELQGEQGLYFIPDGLTDIRGVIIENSDILFLSKARSGIIMTLFQGGNSYPVSYAFFKPTEPDKCFDN
ncbi:hypothetical protein [Halothermothrix orenii]|uniref:Uncharacterized protein n=1 Tax=Halothermothrix orenii (strain H 168 / OCM 544 / DSM 9562) TaxID=373903 RepID=B8CXQ7_HALOH|nr:hypothetical protein [Halothermothrix orenii]ACL70076.1 hypothetical protein Hore_13260 [Halothermothrix orenii H 168]